MAVVWVNKTTWSMMSLPTYKMARGMADLMIRNIILQMVSEGLVRQTILKKPGRLLSAEKRSLKLIDAIVVLL